MIQNTEATDGLNISLICSDKLEQETNIKQTIVKEMFHISAEVVPVIVTVERILMVNACSIWMGLIG